MPVSPDDTGFDLSLDATLRRAARRRASLGGGPSTEAAAVAPGDLCRKVRYRPVAHLIVFVVDTSGSMGTGREARMKAAKGAVLAILRRAYQHRHQVALVAFGGEEARVVLPPTSSIALASIRLRSMPTGGATPFADGLYRAWQMIRIQRRKHPENRPVLLVISDGEANVPLGPGRSPFKDLADVAAAIRQDRVTSVLIDVTDRYEKGLEMRGIARQMGAAYIKASDLGARQLLEAVRSTGGGW